MFEYDVHTALKQHWNITTLTSPLVLLIDKVKHLTPNNSARPKGFTSKQILSIGFAEQNKFCMADLSKCGYMALQAKLGPINRVLMTTKQ